MPGEVVLPPELGAAFVEMAKRPPGAATSMGRGDIHMHYHSDGPTFATEMDLDRWLLEKVLPGLWRLGVRTG